MKGNNYNLIRKIVKIGLPISLENMIYSLMNFIDIFMVGSERGIILGLGKVAVAGVGFANQIFNIFLTSLFGLNSGASILSSQYFGSKNFKDQKKCLSVTLFLGLAFSYIFLLGGWIMPEKLLGIFTKDADVIESGTRYFKIAVYTFPLVAISMAYSMQLRAMGKTQYTFYSSVMGLLINMITNYSLIYGNFGMPALGVEGAAYATVFARIISTLYTVGVVYYYKLPIASSISELFDVQFAFFKKTLKISLPVFIHEFFWILGASIYIVIFGRIGTDEAVSIEIVKSISNLTFTMLFGFCMATSVIIGNEIGAGNEEEAYNYSIKLLYAGIFFGIIISTITYLIIPVMLVIYTCYVSYNECFTDNFPAN